MQDPTQQLPKATQINIILALENLRVFVQTALQAHLTKINNQELKNTLEAFFKDHAKNLDDKGDFTRFITAEFLSSPKLIDERIKKINKEILNINENLTKNYQGSVDVELTTEILKALSRLYERCKYRHVYTEDNQPDPTQQIRPFVEQKIRLINPDIKDKVNQLLQSIKPIVEKNYSAENFSISDQTERHPSCFISYAWPLLPDDKRDETWTQTFLVNLVKDLKLAGINAKIDLLDSRWGHNSISYMNLGVKNSDFILLIGTNSLHQKHIDDKRFGMAVRNEINLIIERANLDAKTSSKSSVFPVLLSSQIETALPQDFKRYSVIESLQDHSYLSFLQQILKRLCNPEEDENKDYDVLWNKFYSDQSLQTLREKLSADAVKHHYLSEIKKRQWFTSSHNEKSLRLVESLDIDHENKKYFTPAELWNAPSSNPNFIGRKGLLEAIKNKLQDNNNTAPVKLTCHGLGGVGKTQLALAYLYENVHNYRFIAWFHADNEEKLFENYLSVATKLNIDSSNKSRHELIESVKAYFEKQRDWLLIFDDAASNELVKTYSPRIGGSVIVTTRQYDGSQPGNIEVNVFTKEEAKEYIKKILNNVTDDQINQLSELLGRLPLALAQACTFIKMNPITVEKYIEYFNQVRDALWSKENPPPDYDHGTVAVTWLISFTHIKKISEFACELLGYCGYLNTHDIPTSFLVQIPHQKSELEVMTALGILNQYSMIEFNGKRTAISLHKLVQLVLRDNLQKTKHLYIDRIILAFNHTLPNIDVTINQLSDSINKFSPVDDFNQLSYKYIEFIPHLEALAQYIDNSNLNSGLFSFYVQLGNALYLSGMIQSSAIHFQNSLNIIKKLSADDFQSEWMAMCLLYAQTCMMNDDHQLAFQLYTRALAIHKKLTGTDQLKLYIMKNIGVCCLHNNDAHQGLQYLEAALNSAKKIYGDNSVAVANTLYTIGHTYHLLGKALIANHYLSDHQQLIKKLNLEKKFNSPNSMTIQGEHFLRPPTPAERIEFLSNEIAKAKSIHGNNHPLVIGLLRSLGTVFLQSKEYDKALIILREACKTAKTVFGDQHSAYYDLVMILADTYHTMGNLHEALKFYQEVLVHCQNNKILEDFQKAHILSAIGHIYLTWEKPKEAALFLTQSQTTTTDRFGDEHPLNCRAFFEIGNCHFDLQNYQEALNFYLKALKLNNELLPNLVHPDLIELYGEIGRAYLKMGDNKKAHEYLNKGINLGIQVLDHDDILMAKINYLLAEIHIDKEELNQAKTILEKISLKFDDYYKMNNKFAIDILFALAVIHTRFQNKDEALSYCNHALLLLQMEDSEGNFLADIYLQLALINHELVKDFSEAERNCEMALVIYEKNPYQSIKDYATCLFTLGDIYLSGKKFKKSLEKFKQVLEIYLQSEDYNFNRLIGKIEECHENLGEDPYVSQVRDYANQFYRYLSYLYFEQHRNKKSDTYYNILKSMDPNLVPSHLPKDVDNNSSSKNTEQQTEPKVHFNLGSKEDEEDAAYARAIAASIDSYQEESERLKKDSEASSSKLENTEKEEEDEELLKALAFSLSPNPSSTTSEENSSSLIRHFRKFNKPEKPQQSDPKKADNTQQAHKPDHQGWF